MCIIQRGLDRWCPVKELSHPENSDSVNSAKKQHFIPQFLLKNFSHGKKGKEKLWVFDKQTKHSYLSTVRDTGHENRFYEGKNLDGQEIEGESITQFVDNIGAAAIKSVLKGEVLPLSGKERVHIAYFVAAQMFRVPSVRNSMEFLRNHMIAKWGENITFGHDNRGNRRLLIGRLQVFVDHQPA